MSITYKPLSQHESTSVPLLPGTRDFLYLSARYLGLAELLLDGRRAVSRTAD
jgi:hypothetical protein